MMIRSTSFLPLLLLSLILFTSAGCAALDRAAVLESLSSNPEAGTYIEGVPVIEQDDMMCGPAALASVIAYHDPATGPQQAYGRARAAYTDELEGTLPLDLFLYAKGLGLGAEYYGGGFDDLRVNLATGRPLILFVNLGLEAWPVGHYLVAVGFDDRLEAVVVHSGGPGEEVMTYTELERRWAKTGYATLLVTPPGESRDN